MLRRTVIAARAASTPMDALATHIYRHRAGHGGHFDRYYGGAFKDMPLEHCRPVLFLDPGSCAAFEKNQVPVRFQTRTFKSRWGGTPCWNSYIDGPTGSGKSCFGLFGLTTPEQLLVRIAAPPPFHTPQGDGLSSRVSACIVEAEQQAKEGQAGLSAEACRCYTDAMSFHIQDLLEAGVGKRSGVAADQAVETIFFFDGFNALDTRGHIGRTAVRGLLGDCSRLGSLLVQDFGLKLHGIAMAGTGLSVDIPVGSMPSCYSGNYFVPLGMPQWRCLTDKSFLQDETVPAHTKAALNAALGLPRLAALVLESAEFNPTVGVFERGAHTMKYLHMHLLAAIPTFVGMSGLSGRADTQIQCRSLSVNCVRLMLFPLEIGELDDTARSLVAESGLATPCFDFVKRCFVIQIGADQRLLLRHFFQQADFPRPFYMRAFKTAVTHFLLIAASGSSGKTLSEFVGALNAFFSHSAQYGRNGHDISRPTVKVTDGLAQHVLRVKKVAMACLEACNTVEVSPEVAVVVVNEKNGDLPWDVQLVLPVTAPGADEVEHVTFNVEMIPFLVPSFAEVRFDDREAKAATAPTVVPGARHAGYAAVVGRLQREGRIRERGAPVWHVNSGNPDSLGVVPFPPGCTDEVLATYERSPCAI